MIKSHASKIKLGVLVGFKYHPVVETLAENMGKLLGNNVKLDMITNVTVSQRILKYYQIYNYVSKPTRSTLINLIKDFYNTFVYCIREKPDALLHILLPNLHGLIVALVGRILKVPSIVRFNGEFYLHYKLARNYTEKIKYLLMNNLLGFIAIKAADWVVPNSLKLMKDLSKYRSIDSNVKYLPQPVDTSRFHPATAKRPFRYLLNLPLDSIIVLYVGRLSFWKGSEILLYVVRQVLAKSQNYYFVLIGNGSYKEKFSSLAPSRVRILDHVNRDYIDLYYKAADVFIFPSLIEGNPNAVLEAISSGIPVISSHAGELSLLVTNLCSQLEDYVNRLINRDYVVDKLPSVYDWNLLRGEYLKFLSAVVNRR